eukprot:47434-Prorocentrum_minimum.AAC.2
MDCCALGMRQSALTHTVPHASTSPHSHAVRWKPRAHLSTHACSSSRSPLFQGNTLKELSQCLARSSRQARVAQPILAQTSPSEAQRKPALKEAAETLTPRQRRLQKNKQRAQAQHRVKKSSGVQVRKQPGQAREAGFKNEPAKVAAPSRATQKHLRVKIALEDPIAIDVATQLSEISPAALGYLALWCV